ncbi:MAG: tetratricopeptide repeat protein, partial [Spirochaetota bacterium]
MKYRDMDDNGQLNFSDAPLTPGLSEAYSFMETGDFDSALKIFDQLILTNMDSPGVVEGYRTTRFWLNRITDAASIREGKDKADFFLCEWQSFLEYSDTHNIRDTHSFRAAERYVYYIAAEHYNIAFKKDENPTNNIDLVLNLSICFLKISEYSLAVDTLEYARTIYVSNPRILSMLGEAYYHLKEVPKALLLFREAFFIDPSMIDLTLIRSEPVSRLYDISVEEKSGWGDPREWIPVFGHVTDLFYVKRHLNMQMVDAISSDVYMLEKSYHTMSVDRLRESNVLPRLINKYLWLFDYYKEQ